MVVFGKDAWLRGGEAFSIYFGILGRFVPMEVRVKALRGRRECGACGCRTPCGARKDGCADCYECVVKASHESYELDLRPPLSG